MENLIHKMHAFENMQEENGRKYNAVMFTILPKNIEDLLYDMDIPSGRTGWSYESAKEKGLIVGEVKFLKQDREALGMFAFAEEKETTVFTVPVSFLTTINPASFTKGHPNFLKEVYEKAKKESVVYGEYTIASNTIKRQKR